MGKCVWKLTYKELLVWCNLSLSVVHIIFSLFVNFHLLKTKRKSSANRPKIARFQEKVFLKLPYWDNLLVEVVNTEHDCQKNFTFPADFQSLKVFYFVVWPIAKFG